MREKSTFLYAELHGLLIASKKLLFNCSKAAYP